MVLMAGAFPSVQLGLGGFLAEVQSFPSVLKAVNPS